MNTIVDQLESASKTWKSYAESMDAYDGPDLASVKTTPNFSLIVPNTCSDGHATTCVDEAEFEGADEASSACCDAPLGPNSPSLGGPVPGPGGGRTGAIAISPFIKPGTVSSTPYNHYSTLRTVEDIFGQAHLGYAANDGVSTFGTDVFIGQ